jgi:hypothetical protein
MSSAGDAELRAEERARAGERVLGRHRREDHVVDLALVELRRLERPLRRDHREVAHPLALSDVVPLLDPRAWADPLIAGVHHLRQLVVRDRPSRDVASGADDRDARHSISPSGIVERSGVTVARHLLLIRMSGTLAARRAGAMGGGLRHPALP